MPRRGENIRKRKDGRWEGRYYTLDLQSGRKVTHSVYAMSYGEVKEKLSIAKVSVGFIAKEKSFTTEETSNVEREFHSEEIFYPEEIFHPEENGNLKRISNKILNSERISDREVCFHMVAEEWFAVIKCSKKYATYIKYHFIYEKYIKEKLGMFPFSKLEEDILAGIFQNEGKERLSDSLQKSISCVLNQILSYAASHYQVGLFQYTYQKQRTGKKPVEVLSQTEQVRLLQYLYEEMDLYKLGILLCISTGLRLGEICALKWADVDMKGKVLYVNTTVQRITVDGSDSRTNLLEGEPKSIFSKREIPLSDEMIKLLYPYYNEAKEYVINGNKPMEPRTYQNKFQRYLQMAGVEKKNFHILRHTFATNCINNGIDVKSLSEILGHSDVKITLNCYVHPTIETKRQYMNSLSVIYGQYRGQPC